MRYIILTLFSLILAVCATISSAVTIAEYQCDVTPDQLSDSLFTWALCGDGDWTASSGILTMTTSSNDPEHDGVWFGNLDGSPNYQNPHPWEIPEDDIGTYVVVRMKIQTGSDGWRFYCYDGTSFFGSEIVDETMFRFTHAEKDTFYLDTTTYHEYSVLLKQGFVTLWIDGELQYSGPAGESSNEGFLIGDATCASLQATGTLDVDYVYVDSAEGITHPIQIADLSLWKQSTSSFTTIGEEITYNLVVTNNGPAQATSVTVEDLLPPGVVFVSGTPSQGLPCIEVNGKVICDLGNIANGDSVTIEITGSLQEMLLLNSAGVSADQFDSNSENSMDSSVTSISCGTSAASILSKRNYIVLILLALVLGMWFIVRRKPKVSV